MQDRQWQVEPDWHYCTQTAKLFISLPLQNVPKKINQFYPNQNCNKIRCQGLASHILGSEEESTTGMSLPFYRQGTMYKEVFLHYTTISITMALHRSSSCQWGLWRTSQRDLALGLISISPSTSFCRTQNLPPEQDTQLAAQSRAGYWNWTLSSHHIYHAKVFVK